MNLPFFIAKRYLLSKKSHNAINFISAISVIGICIGTMALVIVLSAFNGLSDLVKSLYTSFNPEMEITIKQGKTFDPSAAEILALKKIPNLAHYTEVMEGNALLKSNDKQSLATIKGVSDEFAAMSGFDTLIREGHFNITKNNVVLGAGISHVLESSPGDLFTPISIFAPKRGNANTINPEDGLTELKIYTAGTFAINDEFDYKYAIMNIEKARELLDYKNEVTSIELSFAKNANLDKVQTDIEKILGDKYVIKNRAQQNALFYKTMKSEKLWTFLILIFILIIATFNVIGSLTMLIIEKKKDIGILHNMGADLKLIRKIFFVEGMLITIIGAFSGIVLGTVICVLQMKFSLVKISEGLVVDSYPISFRATDFIYITIAVLIIGAFAAWYPVRVFTKKHLLN